MFTFFRRMKSAVSSIHTMLEKGEEPENMLDQYVRELREELSEGEAAVTKIFAEQKLLGQRIVETQEKVQKRDTQVRNALNAGKEDFARRALEDKLQLERELEQLTLLKKYVDKQATEAREKLNELKVDYQEMKLKRDMLNSKTGVSNARAEMKYSVSEKELPIHSEVEYRLKEIKASIKNSERG